MLLILIGLLILIVTVLSLLGLSSTTYFNSQETFISSVSWDSPSPTTPWAYFCYYRAAYIFKNKTSTPGAIDIQGPLGKPILVRSLTASNPTFTLVPFSLIVKDSILGPIDPIPMSIIIYRTNATTLNTIPSYPDNNPVVGDNITSFIIDNPIAFFQDTKNPYSGPPQGPALVGPTWAFNKKMLPFRVASYYALQIKDGPIGPLSARTQSTPDDPKNNPGFTFEGNWPTPSDYTVYVTKDPNSAQSTWTKTSLVVSATGFTDNLNVFYKTADIPKINSQECSIATTGGPTNWAFWSYYRVAYLDRGIDASLIGPFSDVIKYEPGGPSSNPKCTIANYNSTYQLFVSRTDESDPDVPNMNQEIYEFSAGSFTDNDNPFLRTFVVNIADPSNPTPKQWNTNLTQPPFNVETIYSIQLSLHYHWSGWPIGVFTPGQIINTPALQNFSANNPELYYTFNLNDNIVKKIDPQAILVEIKNMNVTIYKSIINPNLKYVSFSDKVNSLANPIVPPVGLILN